MQGRSVKVKRLCFTQKPGAFLNKSLKDSTEIQQTKKIYLVFIGLFVRSSCTAKPSEYTGLLTRVTFIMHAAFGSKNVLRTCNSKHHVVEITFLRFSSLASIESSNNHAFLHTRLTFFYGDCRASDTCIHIAIIIILILINKRAQQSICSIKISTPDRLQTIVTLLLCMQRCIESCPRMASTAQQRVYAKV